jgi:large repetitive protein
MRVPLRLLTPFALLRNNLPRAHRRRGCFAQRPSLFALLIVALACAGAMAQKPTVFSASTKVNQTSLPLSVSVTMTANGVATTPQAFTQGLLNADFSVVAGGTCASGTTYTIGQQCSVNVVFEPKHPGQRMGAVVISSTNSIVIGTALLSGLAIGPLPVLAPGRIDTVAGDADWIYQSDGRPATGSPIFLPKGVVTDATGNLYISDSENNRIRRVDAVTGLISTIGGTGSPGYQGDGVPATLTEVDTPAGLLLDGAGNLYIADSGNHIVRRIDAFTGIITTVAGTPGVQGLAGDGGLATDARLSFPENLAFDAAGDLLIADTGNNVVREVDAVTGLIRTIAGTGTAGFNGDNQLATTAQLSRPWSIAVSLDGSIYIADLANNLVRRVSPLGIITTAAGSATRGFSGDGGLATAATLSQPAALAFDPAGDLYIADSDNNRIREVNATTGLIETICGTTNEAFQGDGAPANFATLYGPYALFLDSSGNLFVADMFHNRIRRINALATILQYATIKVGKVSGPQPVAIANEGNADLLLTPPTLLNAATDIASTTCAAAADIPSAAGCIVGAEFAPTVTGDPVLGSITVNSTASSTAPVIDLSGEVLSITPTTLSLASSTNPSLVGATVIFTATVDNGGGPLTGTVLFFDGATQWCSQPITANSVACSTSTLTLGQHSITAKYSGDIDDAAATSPILLQVVQQTPALLLTATPNPAVVTASVTLTLTASSSDGVPSGTASFYDGPTAIGAATLSFAGIASFPTSSLTPGTHSVSVHYAGDSSNAPGVSNLVSLVIQQAATVTTLSSSPSTAAVSSTVVFTATVTSADGPAPTGTVQFLDGTTSLGSGNVGSNGVATLPVASLPPGSQAIVAVYSGDADDATSSSTALVEVIQQIATATTLSADHNPIFAGATLNLTAVVTVVGGVTPVPLTGKVAFSEGTTRYGSVVLDATGHATLALSTLSAGTHSLVADYRGSTDYAISSSTILVQVVQSTDSTIILSSAAATTLAGEPTALTANVTTGTGIPTGMVTFKDGGATIGLATLNAQGSANFTTSILAVGVHTLTAAYGGDTSYNPSSSAILKQTIILATPALILTGPATPVDAGNTFAVTVAFSSNGIVPTSTLTLRDGTIAIASQTISADGTFTFSNLNLSLGTHSITAVYAGDADNAAATSPAIAVIVQLAPTATSLSSSANPSTLGQKVTFTATVSSASPNPGGPVNFLDGATSIGSSTLNAGGTANLSTSALTFGAHTITAVYQGDTNHATSTSALLSEQIVVPSTEALSSSANPAVYGVNVVFTARITGSASKSATGSIVFRDGASTLGTSVLDATGTATFDPPSLAVGSHTISASYVGDTSYASTSANLVQTIQNATTRISLAGGTNPATYLTPETFTATVTGNGGIATGTVTFTEAGALIGMATLNSSGVAQFTTSTLAPGTHTVVANYVGDPNIGASSSVPLTISVKELTSLSLASNVNPLTTLSPVILTAAVTNSGAGQGTGIVTFTDGSAQLGTAILDATGHASLTVASMLSGNHVLLASYAGDADNFPSTSPSLTEGVQLRPTTIAVTGSSTDANNSQQVTLIAAVGWSGPVPPTGTVSFAVGSAVLGSAPVDSIGIATLTVVLSSTTESIVATYNGDASYATSTSLATNIAGGAATQFTMQLSPPSLTFASGQHSTANLILSSLSGFSDNLALGCLGLPFAATCTFSKTQVALAANGNATVLLTVDTGNPLGAGGSASVQKRPSGVLLCFLPCLLGIGFIARRRKFKVPTLLLTLCMVAMTLTAAGCSGLRINGTPPGTYTFKVTAQGMNTGTTSSQTMTLTVTQ